MLESQSFHLRCYKGGSVTNKAVITTVVMKHCMGEVELEISATIFNSYFIASMWTSQIDFWLYPGVS